MPRPRASRTLENAARRFGFAHVAGVDEVGRGCLAGPVVAGAVVLQPDEYVPGVADSKVLTAADRERLFDRIAAAAVTWHVAIVEPDEIAAHLAERNVGDLPPVVPSGDPDVDHLVRCCLEAMVAEPGADSDSVFVGGAARMAAAFDAVETVRRVLGILEQQLVVVTLLRDVLDRGLSVAIGSETGMAPLADCSLVVAPYDRPP